MQCVRVSVAAGSAHAKRFSYSNTFNCIVLSTVHLLLFVLASGERNYQNTVGIEIECIFCVERKTVIFLGLLGKGLCLTTKLSRFQVINITDNPGNLSILTRLFTAYSIIYYLPCDLLTELHFLLDKRRNLCQSFQ